ncbi:MAG TPA: hypothetical protein VNG13_02940 [Mycobacteriales bacterium]|nr:hypothetical protein [Mycobacteriales bacterium]
MIVPIGARAVAAVAGGGLVLIAAKSLIGTVVVPRRVRSWLTRAVDRAVDDVFHVLVHPIDDAKARDRLYSAQAATILLGQLATWLTVFFVGFALLDWPFAAPGIGAAFAQAGSSLFTLGYAAPHGVGSAAVDDVAALTGLVTIALQIGYLPTLYGAFNRRETEVTLLYSRAGLPAWGPELLLRTRYGFQTESTSTQTLPELYVTWERWAADVAESHTTYLPLARFRSPIAYASWVTALLAVLDSAAMYLALCPTSAPVVPARMCLRMGFTCFQQIALALGAEVEIDPDPGQGISLTYEEFRDAVGRLASVNFPLEREPEEAWPHFVGWRVNYEQAAYAVAAAVAAPPAMWSGPRRHPVDAIAPVRPPNRQPSSTVPS